MKKKHNVIGELLLLCACRSKLPSHIWCDVKISWKVQVGFLAEILSVRWARLQETDWWRSRYWKVKFSKSTRLSYIRANVLGGTRNWRSYKRDSYIRAFVSHNKEHLRRGQSFGFLIRGIHCKRASYKRVPLYLDLLCWCGLIICDRAASTGTSSRPIHFFGRLAGLFIFMLDLIILWISTFSFQKREQRRLTRPLIQHFSEAMSFSNGTQASKKCAK